MDIEGLDFLEMKLERLEEAHKRGVRHAQLVHYTPNDIGDFQTGAVTHNGLTPFGADAIRALHRLGFVCDVAHATQDTVKQATKVATKPLLLSHTALLGSKAMGPTRLQGRQITPDHARIVAETGGSVGIWHFFPSLDKYVDGVKEMVDVIGVDHVSIGTDQQVTAGSLQDYSQSTCCGFPARASLMERERSVEDVESPRRCGGSVTLSPEVHHFFILRTAVIMAPRRAITTRVPWWPMLAEVAQIDHRIGQ
jgi:microsomal dipeptidase-like Zn-dependent dipeptidase